MYFDVFLSISQCCVYKFSHIYAISWHFYSMQCGSLLYIHYTIYAIR